MPYEQEIFVQEVIWSIFSFNPWDGELRKQLDQKALAEPGKIPNLTLRIRV
ncbi:hypothetical protein [Chryseobacterium sp. MDT2-18]|uniref:hypothetical protein n=1 Tax=Chryseobacterium sp. MDT2-18 TaxID=1259136 RepID=UPI0027D79064|nr:hypothetical protein [Chryseobacterium sp. MDT2-18]